MARSKTRKKSERSAQSGRFPLYTLHIVSDGTGNLASHMINAVLTQFPGIRFKEVYHVFKHQKKDVEEVARAFKKRRHIVLYALINAESKRSLHELCAAKGIPHFDLTGSLVQFIADHTNCSPVNELSRLHETHAGYFRRIEAMEFTAQHDDGRRIETIGQAEIVIVGLSRVSKSPTSTFLGSHGYKVANVSIARETGFPPELEKAKGKIVAFTLEPRALYDIRSKRFEEFSREIGDRSLGALPYTDLRDIVSEVVYAEREYRKRGYPIVSIRDKTVEEIAATVLKELRIPRKVLAYAQQKKTRAITRQRK